jgi:hypothetical protein
MVTVCTPTFHGPRRPGSLGTGKSELPHPGAAVVAVEASSWPELGGMDGLAVDASSDRELGEVEGGAGGARMGAGDPESPSITPPSGPSAPGALPTEPVGAVPTLRWPGVPAARPASAELDDRAVGTVPASLNVEFSGVAQAERTSAAIVAARAPARRRPAVLVMGPSPTVRRIGSRSFSARIAHLSPRARSMELRGAGSRLLGIAVSGIRCERIVIHATRVAQRRTVPTHSRLRPVAFSHGRKAAQPCRDASRSRRLDASCQGSVAALEAGRCALAGLGAAVRGH